MDQQDTILEVEISRITVNRYQPRRQFSQEELQELAQSIKTVGIIHPPLVRPSEEGNYELVSGERRLRAAELAGLKKIPVVVRQSSHPISAQAALIENLQRVDLNPIEIALAFQRLMKEFNLGQEELAQRMGKKRSTLANYIRLLSLPQAIQDSVSKGFISMGHAKVILSLVGEERQTLLHELILRDDLTVRAAEKSAEKISEKVTKKAPLYVENDFLLNQLAEKMQHRLGTKVVIQGMGKKGRISIDYYSYDDLDRLLAILGVAE
jgi:ParB family chromosome partitioning protein